MQAQHPKSNALSARRVERQRFAVQVQYKRKIARLVAKSVDLSQHGLRISGMERLRGTNGQWPKR